MSRRQASFALSYALYAPPFPSARDLQQQLGNMLNHFGSGMWRRSTTHKEAVPQWMAIHHSMGTRRAKGNIGHLDNCFRRQPSCRLSVTMQ